ncbi:hypothetical protein A2U01_0037457 [Trifolium medium]|uniref:Uncharacterized protein n=1 Tax=Trifolium medium TaxID=97028 RepID=A0A392PZB5_9FABA|nr:hypothetical protein [Trifolium medium]
MNGGENANHRKVAEKKLIRTKHEPDPNQNLNRWKQNKLNHKCKRNWNRNLDQNSIQRLTTICRSQGNRHVWVQMGKDRDGDGSLAEGSVNDVEDNDDSGGNGSGGNGSGGNGNGGGGSERER